MASIYVTIVPIIMVAKKQDFDVSKHNRLWKIKSMLKVHINKMHHSLSFDESFIKFSAENYVGIQNYAVAKFSVYVQ